MKPVYTVLRFKTRLSFCCCCCCWNRHTNTCRVLMACVKVVIRVKCNIKSTIVRTSTAAVHRMKLRLGQIEQQTKKSQLHRLCIHNVLCVCRCSVDVRRLSAHGYSLMYLLIRWVCPFLVPFESYLFPQTHQAHALGPAVAIVGWTQYRVRAIHCSDTTHQRKYDN